MTFLNNPRYKKFEKEATGDSLRGLPRNDFPWIIKTENKVDNSGEIWNCTARVTRIESNKNSAEIQAEFEFESTCTLPANTLERMGFDPSRIELIGDGQIEVLREVKCHTRTCHMDKLLKLAESGLALFFEQINKVYTKEKKHHIVAERLAHQPFCRFSE